MKRALIAVFALMLVAAAGEPTIYPAREPMADVGNLQFLRGAQFLNALTTSIAEAKSRIFICMFIFSSAENPEHPVAGLIERLKSAHAAGGDVLVVIDERFREKNQLAVQQLRTAGVDIRYDNSARIMHAKLVICDNTVFVGSANFSASALTGGNIESTVTFEDAAAADRLYATRLDFYSTAEREAESKAAERFLAEAMRALQSDEAGKARRELAAAGIDPDALIAAKCGWIPDDETAFRTKVREAMGVKSGWQRWNLPAGAAGCLVLPGQANGVTIVDWKNWKIVSGQLRVSAPVIEEVAKRVRGH